MKEVKLEELSGLERAALDEAERALQNAYEPVSDFRVGACLFFERGETVSGANFANAAYGSSVCAERSAVLRANAMGLIRQARGIAVMALNAGKPTPEVTAPCGECRQVLYEVAELAGVDLKVIMATADRKKIVAAGIRELLPMAFGPNDLKKG